MKKFEYEIFDYNTPGGVKNWLNKLGEDRWRCISFKTHDNREGSKSINGGYFMREITSVHKAGYQICPWCNGSGENRLLDPNTKDQTCQVCNGKKIISIATGCPPHSADRTEDEQAVYITKDPARMP